MLQLALFVSHENLSLAAQILYVLFFNICLSLCRIEVLLFFLTLVL